MNLPNSLTLVRIFFIPLIVAVLVEERIALHWNGLLITNDLIALLIFWVAATTDLLDGYLARRWGQVTTIGTLMDPIADKLLVSAALIALVEERVVASWLVVLIIGREFAVSGLRAIAAAEGYTISANELGKTKTFFQVVAISLLVLSIHHPAFLQWATWSLYVVVFFSIWSAISYFRKFWRKIDIRVKQRSRRELLDAERDRRRALLADRREARLLRRRERAAVRAARTSGASETPPAA